MSSNLQVVKSVDDVSRVAKALAASGYFKDANDVAKAFVKVLAGHELGIPAFAAMTGIHIIQGKPEIGANILASLVKCSGKYNYKVTAHNDEICSIEFFEKWGDKWEKIGTSEFSASDAKRAGTQNMQKFPRNMLFARAMSNGVRWHCPDVTSGVAVYSTGEISGDNFVYGEVDTSTGEVIDAEVAPENAPEKPQIKTVSGEQVKRLKTMVGAFAGENGLSSQETSNLQEAFKSAINNYIASTGKQFRISSTKDLPSGLYEKITGELFDDLCQNALDIVIANNIDADNI